MLLNLDYLLRVFCLFVCLFVCFTYTLHQSMSPTGRSCFTLTGKNKVILSISKLYFIWIYLPSSFGTLLFSSNFLQISLGVLQIPSLHIWPKNILCYYVACNQFPFLSVLTTTLLLMMPLATYKQKNRCYSAARGASRVEETEGIFNCSC